MTAGGRGATGATPGCHRWGPGQPTEGTRTPMLTRWQEEGPADTSLPDGHPLHAGTHVPPLGLAGRQRPVLGTSDQAEAVEDLKVQQEGAADYVALDQPSEKGVGLQEPEQPHGPDAGVAAPQGGMAAGVHLARLVGVEESPRLEDVALLVRQPCPQGDELGRGQSPNTHLHRPVGQRGLRCHRHLHHGAPGDGGGCHGSGIAVRCPPSSPGTLGTRRAHHGAHNWALSHLSHRTL